MTSRKDRFMKKISLREIENDIIIPFISINFANELINRLIDKAFDIAISQYVTKNVKRYVNKIIMNRLIDLMNLTNIQYEDVIAITKQEINDRDSLKEPQHDPADTCSRDCLNITNKIILKQCIKN